MAFRRRAGEPPEIRQLQEAGYCVVDALAPAEVESLARALTELGVAPDDACVGCVSSADSTDAAYRDAAAALVRSLPFAGLAAFDDPAARRDHRYVITWPGPPSGEGMHHETGAGDLVVDVALDRADEVSGELWVVPGSHRWFDAPHDHPVDEAAAELLGRTRSVPVHLAPGSALVCDARLLRFSLPNRIDRPLRFVQFTTSLPAARRSLLPGRPASAVMPTAAALPLTLAAVEQLVAGHAAAPTGVAPWEPPNAGRGTCARCGAAAGEVGSGTAAARWSGRGRVVCAECRARPLAPPAPSTFRTAPRSAPVLAPLDPLPEGEAAVLADPELDRALRRDGFVLVDEPVISRVRADEVRTRFGELHGWRGEGHLNDFNQRDLRYRARASELIRTELLDTVRPLFTDHDTFLHTFLCKWPGPDNELEPHRDWMYVDERCGERSFLAFVALDDIDEDRGEIRILPGSHRVDSMMRGTGLRPAWLEHEELLERRLRDYTMRAGQVAIWNSALVHSSRPNLSTEPRVGAGLWFSRVGVPLVHLRRIDDERAAMFEIDDEFYRTQNPYRLMVENPPYELTAVLPVQERSFTTAELDRLLDDASA